jgi:LysR family transcriptional regulator for metE and metH
LQIEVRHLRLIQSIAEEGSVTRAGKRLYLSQSALSHQLRDVEEKLGVSLFTRLNKRMILTPAGERLLGAASKVLEELDRAKEDIEQIALNREGSLRISTECYTCYHWLPSLLKIFNQSYPRIELQIVVDATRRPIQALLEGKLDLALISSKIQDSKLSYKPLFRDEMVGIVGSNHPLSSRTFLSAEDFRDEHLILYSSPQENRAVQQVIGSTGVTPRRVSSVQLTEAIVELVKAGVGVGVLSRWAVAPQLASRSLCAIPLTRRRVYRQWYAATLKNKSAPSYLQAFMSLLTDNPIFVMKKERRAEKNRHGGRLVQALKYDPSGDVVCSL